MKTVGFWVLAPAMAGATAPRARASGSLDYYCAAHQNQIRYEFHDGGSEEVKVTLFKAAGIREDRAVQELVHRNSLTLDAYQVSRMLKRADVVQAVGCVQDYEDYEACHARDTTVDVVTQDSVESKSQSKYRKLLHSVTFRNGDRITLDLRNWDANSSDGDFSGTLTLATKLPAYAGVTSLHVDCWISTP